MGQNNYELVQMNDLLFLTVGSSRRFGETYPDVLLACPMSPCQPVDERGYFFGGDIWAIRNPKFPAEKSIINRSTGAHRTRAQIFRIYLRKNGVDI